MNYTGTAAAILFAIRGGISVAMISATTDCYFAVGPNPTATSANVALPANMVVYDLESTVHRPRGWSWPGFRVLFAIWLSAPVEAKKVAELAAALQ